MFGHWTSGVGVGRSVLDDDRPGADEGQGERHGLRREAERALAASSCVSRTRQRVPRETRPILSLVWEMAKTRLGYDEDALKAASAKYDQLERRLGLLDAVSRRERADLIVEFLVDELRYDPSELRFELRYCAALCSDEGLAELLSERSKS